MDVFVTVAICHVVMLVMLAKTLLLGLELMVLVVATLLLLVLVAMDDSHLCVSGGGGSSPRCRGGLHVGHVIVI